MACFIDSIQQKHCEINLERINALTKFFLVSLLFLSVQTYGQGLVNNGATISFSGAGGSVFMIVNGTGGNFLNQNSGSIYCNALTYDINADGTATSSLIVNGDWTNNASNTVINGLGLTTVLNNTSATQNINGSFTTNFFNLYLSGATKVVTAPASNPYPLQTGLNFSVNTSISYQNINKIQIGKLYMGNTWLNSGNIPVSIGDDYANSASGFTVTGDWTYAGIAGVGTEMVGALNYNNLIIASADGASKNAPLNGTTTVAGVVTINDKCTLTTNNRLTLLSTATNTASIAALTGSANITGNLNVQRFITGNYGRGYRLITSPVYSTAGFYTISSLINYTPITGPNPGSGSFDASNTNNSSIWVYREGDPFPNNNFIKDSDYKGVNSLSENIPVGTGLLFFNRGNRTTSLSAKLTGPTFPTPEDFTLSFYGAANKGNVTANLIQNNINNFSGSSTYAVESPGSSTPTGYYYKYNSSYAPVSNLQRTNWYGTTGKAADQATDGFNLIGNPYPSTIDIDQTTFGSDLSPLIYVYNPANKQFSYYSKGSATNGSIISDGNGASRYIASGEGFFARCNVVGSTNAAITFAENNKVAIQPTAAGSPVLVLSARTKGINLGAPVSGFGNDYTDQKIMLQLKTDSLNYDGIAMLFAKNNKAVADNDDGADLDGMSPAVFLSSMSSDNHRMAINRLPEITTNTRIKLYVDATTNAKQTLTLTDVTNVYPKYSIYLIDHYLQDSIIYTKDLPYSLTIDRTKPASFGPNRLELAFKINADGLYKLISFDGEITGRNVTLNWKTQNESTYTVFTIEKSADGGKTFSSGGSVYANAGGSYNFLDNDVANGQYLYRLKQTVLVTDSSYSKSIPINFNALKSDSFFVYPNPSNNYVQVNLPKTVKIQPVVIVTDMKGTTVLKKVFQDIASIKMDVSTLIDGIYVIEVTDATDKSISYKTKIIKQ